MKFNYRGIAQLVAHSLWERGVVSSSLAAPTISLKKGIVMARIFARLAYLSLCIINFSFAALDVAPYQEQADQWIKTNFSHAANKHNTKQLQVIANVLYFSFLRSAATLDAQEIAFRSLQTVWNGWQNIAQTRMNPSKHAPYDINFKEQENLLSKFIDAQYTHRSVGVTYALCAHAAIKENLLDNNYGDALTELRETARTVVAKAFLDVKKVLGNLYNYASDHLRLHELDEDPDDRFNFAQTVAAFIPSFALKSFIEAEKINTKASEHAWLVCTTITGVNKQIWETIESARASYYLAHYRAFLSYLEENYGTDWYIMFNENGIISDDLQDQYLPLL